MLYVLVLVVHSNTYLPKGAATLYHLQVRQPPQDATSLAREISRNIAEETIGVSRLLELLSRTSP